MQYGLESVSYVMLRPSLFTPPKLNSNRSWDGLRVGLFGGSFNPPHSGHLHASEIALKYLGLDAVWWLVTPGNPLKKNDTLPSLDTRINLCHAIVDNPRIIISDIEKELGTVRTYDTVTQLIKRFPKTDFIWFSGTDIAFEFHRWYNWKNLQNLLPFAFIGRPHKSGLVRKNCFSDKLHLKHHFPRHGGRPLLEKGHVYWIFNEPQLDISSTILRSHKA